MKSNTSQAAKNQYANNKAEHVGSFLRPLKLKKARYDFADRVIYEETLRQVEDAEIYNLIDIQLDNDCSVMTDGDFRRGWWHYDFLQDFNGIQAYKTRDGLQFKDVIAKALDVRVTAKIEFPEDHPSLMQYRFLHQAVESFATAKFCLPSPNMMLLPHIRNNRHYANRMADYVTDLGQAYQHAIQALYAEGCRYLQINDEFWAYLCDADQRAKELALGMHPDDLAAFAVQTLNLALANKPEDLVIALHIHRGNFLSSWLYQGGYVPVADFIFEKLNNIDRYLLEFDTERAGSFEPLAKLQGTQAEVFLGLISTKLETLEDKAKVIARIEQAAEYLPLAQLGLCLQSGFASMEEGNRISYDTQWKKLKLMNEIAQQIWR